MRRYLAAFLIMFVLQAVPACLIISSGLDRNLFMRFDEKFEVAPSLLLASFAATMASIALSAAVLRCANLSMKMAAGLTFIGLVLRAVCLTKELQTSIIRPAFRFISATFASWVLTPAYLASKCVPSLASGLDYAVLTLVTAALVAIPLYVAAWLGAALKRI